MPQWLITLVKLEPEKLHDPALPKRKSLTFVAEHMQQAADALQPKGLLTYDGTYVISDANIGKVDEFINDHALNFHRLAVDAGERCTDPECTLHAGADVINLSAMRQRRAAGGR